MQKDYVNEFEAEIMRLFHENCIWNTQNLTGRKYDKHVETLQRLLEQSRLRLESSRNPFSWSSQKETFKLVVEEMPDNHPLKSFIQARIFSNIKG